MVVFGQSDCFPANVVVFGQKWLYLNESGRYAVKVLVFGQGGSSPAKWFFRAIVVVFGQNGCIWAKVVVFGENGCI